MKKKKQIKIKVFNRYSKICVVCKRKINKGGSRHAFAHKKCYNSNNCIICGSKNSSVDTIFSICIDCY